MKMAKLSQQNQRKNSNNNANTNNSANATGMKVKRTRKTVPRDTPPQRSSIYRGVTRHRWTGRYEAHLWDKNCWNESQNKKGRQVYLGAYDDEEAAAHAYDLAALKYWGHETILNFPLLTYEKEYKQMEGQSREEYIGSLRRKSSGFSRGVSKFRGVARHHHNGRWEARIGRVFGNKYLYLGTYATQEEAAVAYDMAAIEYRGLNAVTNFDLSRYIKWLRPNNNNNNNNTNTITTTIQPNSNVDTKLTPKPNLDLSPTFSSHQDHHHPPQPPQQSSDTSYVPITQTRPTTATSALGLLLQSSKFKEMMEMSTAAEGPLMLPEFDPPQCSYTDDTVTTQTHFEPHDFLNYGDDQGDDFIFSELNSFIQPMLQCNFES